MFSACSTSCWSSAAGGGGEFGTERVGGEDEAAGDGRRGRRRVRLQAVEDVVGHACAFEVPVCGVLHMGWCVAVQQLPGPQQLLGVLVMLKIRVAEPPTTAAVSSRVNPSTKRRAITCSAFSSS